MLDGIVDLVQASTISYLVIVGFVWLDAWFPLVPGETLIITGAVLAAQGELLVWVVFLAGLTGAVLGDNFTYLLGDRVGGPAIRRLFRGETSRRRLSWAQDQLRRRPWTIIAARFIPGGRTAVMFSAGLLDLAWRRPFLAMEVTGAVLWALLATVLGYAFGSTFKDSVWLPLLLSFAIAGAVTGVAELRHRRRMGHVDRGGTEGTSGLPGGLPDRAEAAGGMSRRSVR